MSLILTYHNQDFGVVCSDGRVSRGLPDGSREAVKQEIRKKFIVLRSVPNLVLAGSSVSKWMDFCIYDAVRSHVESFPKASFDEVAQFIVHTVHEVADVFRVSSDDARINLNLLGFDPEQRRVRNRAFAFAGDESEHESGVTVSGFIEPEERVGHRLLDRMGSERTSKAVRDAMLSLAQEISGSRPQAVGPPYFFHFVTAEHQR